MREVSPHAAKLLEDLQRTPIEGRAEALGARGNVAPLLAGLIEHASQLIGADTEKAIQATDIVVNLADRLGSKLDRARARRARARALSYTGRFDQALSLCREGVRLAQEAGSAIEASRAQLASMHALGELGQLDEAIRVGEAARETFIAAGEPELAARADINLGGAHQRRDDPQQAIACFDRALKWLANEPQLLAILQSNRGEALVALNDLRGAEQAFTAALQACEGTGAALTCAIFEGNLADLATRQGRLHQALLHFERARRRMDCSPAHLARLRAEQAEAMSTLGMVREALAEYESAIAELDRCDLTLEAARARSGMALALVRMGRPAKAEPILSAAARAFDELGHATARAKVDLVRAEILARAGSLDQGRDTARAAMAVLHERPVESVLARCTLAQICVMAGRLDEADAELASALAAARELDIPPLLAELFLARGRLRRTQQRVSEGIADLREALVQVERVRGTLQAERFRTAFLGGRTAVHEQLVLALLDRGEPDDLAEAFTVAERARSRSLLDRLQPALDSDEGRAPPKDASELALLAELAQARAELSALYCRLGTAGTVQRDAAATATSWRRDVRRAEAALDGLETRLAATRGIGVLYAAPPTLDEMTRWLKPDAAIVSYFIADGQALGFVVRQSGISAVSRLGSVDELGRAMQRLHFQMARALRPGAAEGSAHERMIADVTAELQWLHHRLVAPLAHAFADAQQLTFVPHGPLHLLPFHALHDGRRHMIESYEVRYSPSAGLLVRDPDGLQGDDGLPREALVVGVPDEAAPQILEEAQLVAAVLQGKLRTRSLLAEQATADAVMRAAPHADILHLACHGRFVSAAPMASGLKLMDRWVTLHDLYNLGLRAGLVILSGCETGLNQVNAGDELVGLLRALLAGGARSVIASLWPVHDAMTREFMVDLYGSMNTMDRPAAGNAGVLRSAQLKALRRHRHPAFWAPFMLSGRD